MSVFSHINIKTDPELLALLAAAKTKIESMTPFERAYHFAIQRRGYVVAEMQLRDDDTVNPEMTRDKAMDLYAKMPEGALLAELERLMQLERDGKL